MFKRLINRPIAVVLMAVLLLLSLSVLAERFLRSYEIDLTSEGLYTLSPGTEKLLRDLDEPVRLDFYFSRSLATGYPNLLAYGKRVEETLRKFARTSPATIQVNIIEPEAFSQAEDDAVAAGLSGASLPGGESLYFGLYASNQTDGAEAIPFLAQDREKFLEYDLVKLILSLDVAAMPRLTLLTGLPMAYGDGGPEAAIQGQAQPYVLYQQFREFFRVSEIHADFSAIPAETDVLLIVQPPRLSDDQLYLIDQYVLKGGRAAIFVDPHSESMPQMGDSIGKPSMSNLGPLLASWGVNFDSSKVIGDVEAAQRVNMGGAYGVPDIKDFVLWLALGPIHLNLDDVVTGTTGSLNMASVGSLSKIENSTVEFTPLVSSSTIAMPFDATRASGVVSADLLLRDLQPTGEAYTLSARVQGNVRSAFPDKLASDTNALFEGNIQLVVTADSDLFADRLWVRVEDEMGQQVATPHAGNGGFVLNLLDHLAGSEALLSLRGRGVVQRPFTKVAALRREADIRYRDEEERLQARMQEVEARLLQMEGSDASVGAAYSPEQEAAISRFRDELLATRKALREVNRRLKQDINQLGTKLAIINIAGIPGLIILFVLLRQMVRRRKRASKLKNSSIY